ncbi:MAG TPA: MFS transporter [Actinomycetales bacterium]|nr:MFS transporter [Actinomycetales bacterium]
MSPTFRAMRAFNYRIWMAGAVVSNVGTWMQRVAQDWLVLTILTDNSPVALGITTGLQFAPMLLLAPFAGLVADRLPKRQLLIGTQASMGFMGFLLGVLVMTGTVQLWHVYLLALGLGISAALDGPTRQAFVSEMVPREDLSNAVGLNSASFNFARLIGPGLAGLLIAWVGTGPVFLINAASFLAVIGSLTAMRRSELMPSPPVAREKGQLRDGIRYVRGRPDIILILVIVGMIGTFGFNFQMTTALMATEIFHKGASEYGLLGSIMAIGSLTGALLAARRERPRLRLVIGAALAFGVFTTIACLMPTYTLFAIALVPVGVSSLTLMTAANATVQLSVAPEMRGRVLALYMAVFMGGTPLGAPIIGWIGEVLGARWTIGVGGGVALLTAGACLAYLVRSRDLTVRYRLHTTPHLQVWTPQALRREEDRQREQLREAIAAHQAADTKSAA